jgi:uncharacterized protein YqeY
MTSDAGHAMKARMRVYLHAAMKDSRKGDARLIRALIAAIDNAEAPPVSHDRRAAEQARFGDGSAEVERLLLDGTVVRAVLQTEIAERENAAAEFDRLGMVDHADMLRREVQVARRYVV